MIIAETEQTLRIKQAAIPFDLRRGKPNRVRLSFLENNTLCIETSNGRLGTFEKEFLVTKSKWILRGYLDRQVSQDKRAAFLNSIHQEILLLGEATKVEYHPDKNTFFQFLKGENFIVHAPKSYIKGHKKRLLYHALRRFAEQYLERKVQEWSETTQLPFNRLRIKDLKSKWGSCSSLQNINLNWQLIFLEEELIDYVIVHELMHLVEMNHSPQFWNLVGRFCPDYKHLRKQLKEKQWLVGILK